MTVKVLKIVLLVLWCLFIVIGAIALIEIVDTANEIYKVEKLEELAENEGIDVHYVTESEMPETAKKINAPGLIILQYDGTCDIYITHEWTDRPLILAHEIAHFYAITYESNRSESRAWELGYILLNKFKYERK